MKIAVLGTGSWGTALAQVAADNGHETVMWGRNPHEAEDINRNHQNSKFFSCLINERITASTDLQVIHDADIILLTVPSKAMAEVVTNALPYITKPAIIVNTAKGFHPDTHERLSVTLRKLVPADQRRAVVSLIGPSHAEEVIIRLLTSVNAVSTDEESAKYVQDAFSNTYFRVYRNTDECGAEIGAALKNIMAIAAGILEGIGQGDNARAALMTRGLAEMTRYGVAFGAKKETFLGLDGVGDLIVTCTSKHSRNFMAGLEIGQEHGAEQFWAHNTKTVEGVAACRIVYEEAKRLHIDMPITNQIYQVLYENKSPEDSIRELMMRPLKAE